MSKSFKPDLSALILGALESGPKHGYAITQAIRRAGAKSLKLGEGQLYPVLHRLEQDGFVAAKWETQEGKPSRKVYALTETGSKRLVEKRKKWAEHVKSVSAVLSLTAPEV